MAKKILMVCDSLGGGGAERQLSLLCRAMPDGWEASVFSLGGGVFQAELLGAGVPLIVAKRRHRLDPSPLLAMWREIRRAPPYAVHSWGWMAAMGVDPCCRLLGVPHVSGVIRRGILPRRRGWVLKKASSLGSLAIANSRAGLRSFGVPDRRGRVLYNGFATERMAGFSRPDWPEGPFQIVMAATMDYRKDFPLFLAAGRELATESTGEMQFTALGDGPDRKRLQDIYQDLIAENVFSLPGRVDEVLPYYRTAHVGVMLSTNRHGEGLSNSVMEYMAAGMPVICSDQGGNPELVVDGKTGFLIPVGDHKALAEKICLLRNNPDMAIRMGKAGRERVADHFSVAKMTSSALKIYDEAAANYRV